MNPELLRQYLEYYQDLGVKTLYRRAAPAVKSRGTAGGGTAGPA